MSSGGIVQVGALPGMAQFKQAVQSGVSDVTRLVTGSSAPKTAVPASSMPASADFLAKKMAAGSFDNAWGVSESDKNRIKSDNQWRKGVSASVQVATGIAAGDADARMSLGDTAGMPLSAQDASTLRSNNDFRFNVANAVMQRLSPGAPGASYAITSPSSDTSLFTMPSMQMAGDNKTMLYVGGAVALGALAWFVSKKR
jgi:hypothetical protein